MGWRVLDTELQEQSPYCCHDEEKISVKDLLTASRVSVEAPPDSPCDSGRLFQHPLFARRQSEEEEEEKKKGKKKGKKEATSTGLRST